MYYLTLIIVFLLLVCRQRLKNVSLMETSLELFETILVNGQIVT